MDYGLTWTVLHLFQAVATPKKSDKSRESSGETVKKTKIKEERVAKDSVTSPKVLRKSSSTVTKSVEPKKKKVPTPKSVPKPKVGKKVSESNGDFSFVCIMTPS